MEARWLLSREKSNRAVDEATELPLMGQTDLALFKRVDFLFRSVGQEGNSLRTYLVLCVWGFFLSIGLDDIPNRVFVSVRMAWEVVDTLVIDEMYVYGSLS